jgi:hypothetical protein
MGDLQCIFPLDILMVPSSMLAFSANGEHLTCDGFSHGETVHLGSFEFIADYFSGLSLSPRRSDSDIAFMTSSRSGPPTPWWATIEDSTKEFHMASSGDRGSGLPSPRRLSTVAPPTSITILL